MHRRTCLTGSEYDASYIEIPACGPADPDGRNAAAILNAYVAAAHVTAFRGLLLRRLVVIALAIWLIGTFSSVLPRLAVVAAMLMAACVAIWAFALERRAHRALKSRLIP